MKPKAAFFLSLLTSYGAGGDQKPFIPFAGVTSIPNEGDFSSDNFSPQALSAAGYHAVGPRIARFDILNRLSLQIRQASEQNRAAKRGKGFQVMQEMLAIMGCSYDEIRGVLTALGFAPTTRDLSKYPPLSDITLNNTPTDTKEQTSSETPESKPTGSETPETVTAEVSPDIAGASSEAEPQSPTSETKASSDSETVTANVAPAKKSTDVKPTPKTHKKAPKPLNIYNHRETKEDGTTVEIENNEFWLMPAREKPSHGRAQSKGKRDHKKKFRKPKQEKDFNSGPSKRSSKLENSPFAALAALKADKKD